MKSLHAENSSPLYSTGTRGSDLSRTLKQQYNMTMLTLYGIALSLFMGGGTWPNLAIAADESPAVPGFNEQLNQALGSEGGVQVYQDAAGNVGTLIDPPGGERRFTVQPPQSPSMNLGPPLQLHQQAPLAVPPALTPVHPPSAEFPQKAH